jgi:hypothetical protein
MIPQPSAAPPDLAEAALACPAIDRARKLAEWVGAGRELTSSRVLRPPAAADACRALGIALPPGRLRTAKDVPELMCDWEVAISAGLIGVGTRHARAAYDLAELGPGCAERVLRSWAWAAAIPLGLPADPCAGCLTVLYELSLAAGAVPVAELGESVRSATLEAPEEAPQAEMPCPGCGEIHDVLSLPGLLGFDEDDEDQLADLSREHAEAAVADLTAFGAASDEGDGARITPLGRMLADAIFRGCAPAADVGAEDFLQVITMVPPRIAAAMAEPWLAARSPAGAAGELLAFAESADADQRLAAVTFAREIGSEAAPAWRERATQPGFGAYARRWLADQGEPVVEDPRDEAWLTVEALSVAGAVVPEGLAPLLIGAAIQDADREEAAEMLSQMKASGHPDAARLVESVTRVTGLRLPASAPARRGRSARRSAMTRRARSGQAGSGVYQLKITLRGVSKPPVWRRVAVPADVTLDVLHEVILLAMGWNGGHMHVFSDGWQDYGMPDSELGHADEAGVSLTETLAAPGARMTYTYDFGDDWEHDIVLEKVVPADSDLRYPVCLAGKGACPPDDCGGAWGYADLKETLADPDREEHEDLLEWLGLDSGEDFDPAEFSVDQVNFRLARVKAARLT